MKVYKVGHSILVGEVALVERNEFFRTKEKAEKFQGVLKQSAETLGVVCLLKILITEIEVKE